MNEALTKVQTRTNEVIRVSILDDHRVLTEALTLIIGAEPDMQVISAIDSCEGLWGLMANGCPDVVLLDVALPDGDGLSLVPELKRICRRTSILVLTSLSNDATLLRAIGIGV